MLWTMCAVPDHVEMSKQTIRDRAIAFSKKWASATSEAAERQLFWNDFFAVFGVSLRNVGFFEVAAERLSTMGHGWIAAIHGRVTEVLGLLGSDDEGTLL